MVGELVRRTRLARGMTQGDLALASGLRQTYISQVEQGEIAMPRDHNLDALGRALGISRGEFYREAGMLEGLVKVGSGESDIFDRAPLARLDAELRALPVVPGQPTFAAQLQQLDRLSPAAQERVIRRLARDFLWRLREELEREEGA